VGAHDPHHERVAALDEGPGRFRFPPGDRDEQVGHVKGLLPDHPR
jgi:hypothetical protein